MDRRCSDRRIEIDAAAQLVTAGGACIPCRVADISLGGARVVTNAPVPFGTTMLLRTSLPGSAREVVLPAVVRWTQQGVLGLQFGLLGARETHLITSLAVERAQTLSAADVAWVG